MATYVLRITSLFLSLLDTFETPAYELGLSKRRMSPFKICNIESHIAERLKLDIVVSLDRKSEKQLKTIKQLGIRIGCFVEKLYKDDLFHESQRQRESVAPTSS